MWTLARTRLALSGALAGLVLFAFSLTGCSSRPENSPVVRKKFKELADVQTQVGDMSVQMKQISAEMAAIRKDIGDVKSLSGGGEAVSKIEEIAGRLTSLEDEMAKLNGGTSVNKARQVSSAPGAAPSVESASASADQPAAPKASASAEAKESASKPAPVRKPASSASAKHLPPVRQVSNSAPPKPRGTYYTIQSGDTTESIAKHFNVSPASILSANRLPSGATIFPGQRIYVPAK